MNLLIQYKDKLLAIALLLLLGLVFLSASFGAYPLALERIFQLFGGSGTAEDSSEYFLFWQLRIPRILLAILIGASLSMSGAAVQGLFRNPLAEPSLIGVTAGSMLSAVFFIVCAAALGIQLGGYLSSFSLAFIAFLGGLGTTFLVYRLSKQNGRTSTATMLLAGVAITALCGAATGLFSYFSTEEQLRDITFWSLGSLSGANWQSVIVMAIFFIISAALLLPLSKPLNALLLGEEEAAFMGVALEPLKWRVVIGSCLAVGAAVALSGMIGFLGLLVPHLLRLSFGADHRFLLPASAVLGAILLLLADSFARTILAPAELPIGILTSFLGAPFFLWLILKSKMNYEF